MNRICLSFAGVGIFVVGISLGWGAARLTGKELQEAKELYTDACASCHGDDGKGKGRRSGRHGGAAGLHVVRIQFRRE